MIEALILTCLIEGAVTFLMICGRRFIKKQPLRKGDLRMVYYNLLCNLLTNPLLNLSLYGAALLGAGPRIIFVLIMIGEMCVVAGEYRLYRLMSRESRSFCIILSFVTNIASYGFGRLIS